MIQQAKEQAIAANSSYIDDLVKDFEFALVGFEHEYSSAFDIRKNAEWWRLLGLWVGSLGVVMAIYNALQVKKVDGTFKADLCERLLCRMLRGDNKDNKELRRDVAKELLDSLREYINDACETFFKKVQTLSDLVQSDKSQLLLRERMPALLRIALAADVAKWSSTAPVPVINGDVIDFSGTSTISALPPDFLSVIRHSSLSSTVGTAPSLLSASSSSVTKSGSVSSTYTSDGLREIGNQCVAKCVTLQSVDDLQRAANEACVLRAMNGRHAPLYYGSFVANNVSVSELIVQNVGCVPMVSVVMERFDTDLARFVRGAVQNDSMTAASKFSAAALQIAMALALLHRSGFVHRNLSLGCVLVRLDPFCVVLSDFTESSPVQLAVEVNTHGEPLLLAPELFTNSNSSVVVTEAVDMYAFGMLLWQLNHFGASPDELLQVVQARGLEGLHDALLSPNFKLPHTACITDPLYSLICQCCDVAPLKRLSAKDLVSSLKSAIVWFSAEKLGSHRSVRCQLYHNISFAYSRCCCCCLGRKKQQPQFFIEKQYIAPHWKLIILESKLFIFLDFNTILCSAKST